VKDSQSEWSLPIAASSTRPAVVILTLHLHAFIYYTTVCAYIVHIYIYISFFLDDFYVFVYKCIYIYIYMSLGWINKWFLLCSCLSCDLIYQMDGSSLFVLLFYCLILLPSLFVSWVERVRRNEVRQSVGGWVPHNDVKLQIWVTFRVYYFLLTMMPDFNFKVVWKFTNSNC